MVRFCKIISLLYCFVVFSSCKSRVEFLVDGPLDPVLEQEQGDCLEKEVKGKTICVIKKEETFQVDALNKKAVDFIFVLDVSPSMVEDLARLGQAFEDLMSQIVASHWQIFFTTADHGDHDHTIDPVSGKTAFSHQKWQDYHEDQPYFGNFMYLEHQGKKINQKKLDAQTSDYINVFKDTVTRGPGGDCSLAPYCQGSLEQPLRVLKSSLERLAQGKQIGNTLSLNPSAKDTVSFIITDEDERSENSDQATTAEEVLGTFKKLFPEKSLHSFSFVIQDDECLARQKQYSPQSVYGQKVSKLAELTNGKNISLCEESYGLLLQELSHLVRSLIESLTLKEQPILESEITVEFKKGTPRTEWQLKGRKLIFKEVLELGSEIKVSYFVEQ